MPSCTKTSSCGFSVEVSEEIDLGRVASADGATPDSYRKELTFITLASIPY
jgi:hypothetical protein